MKNKKALSMNKKFGTKSMILDGNGDYISMADIKDWKLGKLQDFTVCGYFYKDKKGNPEIKICKCTPKNCKCGRYKKPEWVHIKVERPKNDLETKKRRYNNK